MVDSINNDSGVPLKVATVLCGWLMLWFLGCPLSDLSRLVDAEGPSEGVEQTDLHGQTAPKENRPDPPASAVRPSDQPDELRQHDFVYRVDYVLDGDTIRLENGKELRLIGVDAPEEDQKWADTARDMVRARIPEGSIIGVDLDRRWWDRYDRLLGYVYFVEQNRDQGRTKVLVNEMLVKQGLARTYFHRRNTAMMNRFIKAQRFAIRKERRLFAQIVESADQYHRVLDHYRFHRPDCKYVRDIPEKYLKMFSTKRQALRSGCSSASCCNP